MGYPRGNLSVIPVVAAAVLLLPASTSTTGVGNADHSSLLLLTSPTSRRPETWSRVAYPGATNVTPPSVGLFRSHVTDVAAAPVASV